MSDKTIEKLSMLKTLLGMLFKEDEKCLTDECECAEILSLLDQQKKLEEIVKQ